MLSHCSPCHPQAPRAHWLLAAAPSTPGCTRELADQGCWTTGPLTVRTHEPGAMRGPGRPGQGGSGPPRTQHMGHEARLSAWHPNWAENWSRSTHSSWPKGWRGGCHCRPTGWGPWGGHSPGAHSRPGAADCVSRAPGRLSDWSIHCPRGSARKLLNSRVRSMALVWQEMIRPQGKANWRGGRLRAEVTAIGHVLHTPTRGAGLGDRASPPFSKGHGCPPYAKQDCAP